MEGPAAVSGRAADPTRALRPAQSGRAADPTRALRPAQSGAMRLPSMTYTEQESELRAAVRDVLEDKADWHSVLARTESPETYDTGLWRTLAADVGCAGLLIPESLGGAGASFREAAVVAEEIGRAVAPVPFLGSAVMATVALLSAAQGDDPTGAAAKLLSGLGAGTTTAALAVPVTAMPGVNSPLSVRIGPASDGAYLLSGTVTNAADLLPADVLVVPADGVPSGLYVVPASDSGVTRVPVTSLDMTRELADLTLVEASATRIAAGSAAERAVSEALRAGAAMVAAEQVGLADRALEITLEYVKHRYQFARPIGSFQAVKHRLADWWVAVTQARAASRYAAACLAEGDADADIAVALAKAACSEAALLAGQEMVQLHGGIGFTWEHPAHLYLKRAKSSSIALGTADRHRASLAGLVDLPGAPG
jgi:alkylation response protein AidB-like acyl-CoA dehydrogenase